jgi:DNA invertase Pin-like site-specific DNA recombinase
MRTREGMAVARAKGRLRGRQLKLSPKQRAELRRMHACGDYSITDLAELFSMSRPTVYRTLRAITSSAISAEVSPPNSSEGHGMRSGLSRPGYDHFIGHSCTTGMTPTSTKYT